MEQIYGITVAEKFGVSGEEKTILHPDAKHISPLTSLRERLVTSKYEEILNTICKGYGGQAISEVLHVHFGSIACGPAVVASDSLVQDQVKAHGGLASCGC